MKIKKWQKMAGRVTIKHSTNSMLRQEIKRLEADKLNLKKQLLQSAKLISMGTLSAIIIHELKNPITAILGYCELMLDSDQSAQELKLKASNILRSANKLRLTINHLRRFISKSNPVTSSKIDINRPLRDSLTIFSRWLNSSNVNIVIEFDESIPLVWVDEHQIGSVFLNLLANSHDAFLSQKDIKKKEIRISTLNCNNGLLVKYQDNAGGMTDEVKARLFEPFFTTKSEDKGTGLGMTIASDIINDFNGSIKLQSTLGEGTSFEIFLPADRRKGSREEAPSSDVDTLIDRPATKPRLLIIDDDDEIAMLLKDYFQTYFDLTIITVPDQALIEVGEVKHDLILVDFVMPEVSGIEILLAAKKSQPETQVVLMTGYNITENQIKNAKQAGVADIIYKPFASNKEVIANLLKLAHEMRCTAKSA